MNDKETKIKIWIRFSILIVNLLLIYFFTKVIVYLTQSINIYIPFELIFLVLATLYFLLSHLLKIKTFGRWVLLLFGKYKNHIAFALIILITLFIIKKIIYFKDIYDVSNGYSSYSLSEPDYTETDSSKLIEISSIDSSDATILLNWLNQNGNTPEDYILEKVSEYQVIVFGEVHERSNYLNLLKEMIPDFYKTGVRIIAMEVCLYDDNELIEKLVTSKQYDYELALEIGRHQPWLIWGWKEYWDILEGVWSLNRSLDVNQEKMKVIGLDSKYEMPSISLVLNSEDKRSGPFYEKLRILQTIQTMPLLQYRDELMAKQIEDQIIKKGEKGIVWVGASHSYLNFKKLFSEKGRMSFILHKKFKGKIFQIYLHEKFYSQKISSYIENIISKSEFDQIGFDIINSPLNDLRDSSSINFSKNPKVCFGDIASGYLYLVPFDSLSKCRFIKDFVTQKMFIKEKPFYEALVGKSFSNADEVNQFFMSIK